MDSGVDRKAASVSGSGSEIGRGTTLVFTSDGAQVLMSAIDARGGEQIFRTIQDAGGGHE